MWRISAWPRCGVATRWAACGIFVARVDWHGSKLHPDRESVVGDCLRVWEVWCVILWHITSPSSPFSGTNFVQPPSVYRGCCSYLKGEKMLVAETSSRAFLSEVNSCVFVRELEEVAHRVRQCFPWKFTKHMFRLMIQFWSSCTVIQFSWPERKSYVPMCLRPYFDPRDELVVQGNLIFKGPRLVVPACMRKELMSEAHATHIGSEGCLRRVRECLFWPMMVSDVKDYVSKCSARLSEKKLGANWPRSLHFWSP